MSESLVDRGRDALARGAWEEALAAFEGAVRQARTPEALEGLGAASWWLDDGARVFETREEAYRLYRERGDRAGAARIALSLFWDYRAFRGDTAVSNGWLQRAERLLEGLESTREYGWLRYRKAQGALFGEHDPVVAREHIAACRALARTQEWIDLDVAALTLEGLAYLAEGDCAAARKYLDEVMAAVIGGELTELTLIGFAICSVINACERMHDLERAAQWCDRLKEFTTRWRIRPLFAVCRTQYAGICLSRGIWQDAEAELTSAASELAATHRGGVPEALARLGELRRRQGRHDEAEALFTEAGPHPLAVLGRAALALDREQPLDARELAERYLRRVPPRDRLARTAALELLVRAAAALSDREAAAAALEELAVTASKLATDPIRGIAASSAGVLALHDSRWDEARTAFEDATDLFTRAGMPFEAARARVDHARALATAGRTGAAAAEAHAAARTFESIGAMGARAEAAQMATQLDAEPRRRRSTSASAGHAPLDRLTARERQVLKLVGEGLSNLAIATRLRLSEHTVHRHVSNILTKLDLPSRAAAAAAAARQGAI